MWCMGLKDFWKTRKLNRAHEAEEKFYQGKETIPQLLGDLKGILGPGRKLATGEETDGSTILKNDKYISTLTGYNTSNMINSSDFDINNKELVYRMVLTLGSANYNKTPERKKIMEIVNTIEGMRKCYKKAYETYLKHGTDGDLNRINDPVFTTFYTDNRVFMETCRQLNVTIVSADDKIIDDLSGLSKK